MKKYILDLTVASVDRPSPRHVLLKLTHQERLPEMLPGQFVEVRIDTAKEVYLRRPISINYVDYDKNELWLLVAMVGKGSKSLAGVKPGDTVNCVLPLGNGFTMPTAPTEKYLLVGGGVGSAPLLYFGSRIKAMGGEPVFLLGARTAADLLQTEEFERIGKLYVTTEDGTAGEKGFVTNHSLLQQERFDRICTCGPKPMMVSVARYAKGASIDCEASLENLMACGIGACLCCVEKTTEGNLCVCKEGPVFNIEKLLWQV